MGTSTMDIVTTLIKSGWKSIAGKHAIYVQVRGLILTKSIHDKQKIK